jgi:uncharacterized protein YdcH (DUF465 family)
MGDTNHASELDRELAYSRRLFEESEELRKRLEESEDERKRLSAEWLREREQHRATMVSACQMCSELLEALRSSDLQRAESHMLEAVKGLRMRPIDVQRNIEG